MEHNWPAEKLRRIILDLHLPDFSPEIGKNLDARSIVENMVKARCEVIVFPAKNHFGLTTYPTAVGDMHPNIKGDLLQEVLQRGREQGMKVVAYYSVGWDEAFRRKNPGCEQRSLYGTPVIIPPLLGYSAPWTMMCLNTAYRDFCIEQMSELSAYPVDGFWLDITYYPPFACTCDRCKKSFRDRTGSRIPTLNWDDPLWREFIQFKSDILSEFFARATQTLRKKDPDMPVTFNLPPPDSWAASGQQTGLGDQIRHMTYLSSEVHFDMYGTLCLPVEVEVNTALGHGPPEMIFCRFADGWDWTVKPSEQISAECLGALSRGAAVMIIDHAYPDGSLEGEAYNAIGRAFERMEQATPWILGTNPMPFAAVHLSERSLFAYGREDPTRHVFPFYGACRTLLESHIPFRVVTDEDLENGLEPCEVLILPNSASMSDKACSAVIDFVASGGALLATYQTSFFDEKGTPRSDPGLNDCFGVEIKGEISPVHYVRLSEGKTLIINAPSRPIPLYGPTLLVEAKAGSTCGGRIVKPFPLEKKQWITHGFAPPGNTTDHPVWVLSETGKGKVVYFPGRICESLLSGDPDLRRLFSSAIDKAAGGIPLCIDGPRCLDVSWRIVDQRDILHLVNIQYPTGRTFPVFSPESYWKLVRESSAILPVKKLPTSPLHRLLRHILSSLAPRFKDRAVQKILEVADKLPKRGVEVADRIPAIPGVTLRVRKRPGSLAKVYSPFSGDLPFTESEDGFIAVRVPEIAINEIVVLEYR